MAEINRADKKKVIYIEEEHHVDMARRAARECAQLMGFGEIKTALIVTSVSELARNILVHAGRGTVTFRTVSTGEKRGLEFVFSDQGSGIEDIERVLRGGYSTKGSLGIGLSGVKRMMDEMEIKSRPGKGTTIWIRKWL
ncbi:MAG: anti-sigma regulatory factor [Syntrophales bacterium]|nr:anti-sigma regulatory factor [Syntrophales bacterium]